MNKIIFFVLTLLPTVTFADIPIDDPIYPPYPPVSEPTVIEKVLAVIKGVIDMLFLGVAMVFRWIGSIIERFFSLRDPLLWIILFLVIVIFVLLLRKRK